MHALKEHRSPAPGLPDLLNWAAVVADGMVLNKDGSLMAGWFYQGQDLATVTPAERNRISGLVNGALATLGSEWMIHQDAIRVEARRYPEASESAFPDPVSSLIEAERRAQFRQEKGFYESLYGLVVTYLPAKQAQSRAEDLLFSEGGAGRNNTRGKGRRTPAAPAGDRAIAQFEHGIAELEERLSSVLNLTRLRGEPYEDEDGRLHVHDRFLQYLHYTLTGRTHPVNLPPCPMYLDAVIGGHEFWTGIVPRLEDQLIQVVAIDGFPQECHPGILAVLDQLPLSYRWSTRFIFQDAIEAQAGLRGYRRKWQQKVRGFWDQVFHSAETSKGSIDQDALQMVSEVDSALAEASSGLVTYGYYTSVVVLQAATPGPLEEAARQVRRLVNNLGFNARIETINTVEAWLGSLPGHAVPNLRRPMLHTMHLADLLPLSSVWAGREKAPCPFYPENSPPLLYAATEGSTPFRLNLHVGDLGHTLMFGPTGAGKSTALALLAAQFRRYRDATVFAFDKGGSLKPLTLGVGGQHFNVAGNENAEWCFAPLALLEAPGELGWAEDWVATVMELQGVALTPPQRAELHRALVSVRDGDADRTLTTLQIALQDRDMKGALEEYTVSGALGQLLDAAQDDLSVGTWAVFEIEELMHRADRVRLPVLLYLFHVLERRLKGQPCLLILDEAWLMLGHPAFREKIREWLKVLRKANCAVVLATQSLADAADSGILSVLTESCPTKIFLANAEAASEENQSLYRTMGCNTAEIATIAAMTPKREYFVRGEGRRRIDLALGPVALSFVGASGKEDLARVEYLQSEHSAEWPWQWLRERGVEHAAYRTAN